jgi:hypothetical protein
LVILFIKALILGPSPGGEGGQTIEYLSTKELTFQLMNNCSSGLYAVPSPSGEG